MRPRYAACILIAAASASRRRLGFIAAKFSSFSVTPRARASAALTSPRSFSKPPARATQSAITVSSAFATSRDVFLRSGLGRTHAAASAITSFAVSAGQPAATAALSSAAAPPADSASPPPPTAPLELAPFAASPGTGTRPSLEVSSSSSTTPAPYTSDSGVHDPPASTSGA